MQDASPGNTSLIKRPSRTNISATYGSRGLERRLGFRCLRPDSVVCRVNRAQYLSGARWKAKPRRQRPILAMVKTELCSTYHVWSWQSGANLDHLHLLPTSSPSFFRWYPFHLLYLSSPLVSSTQTCSYSIHLPPPPPPPFHANQHPE